MPVLAKDDIKLVEVNINPHSGQFGLRRQFAFKHI